MALIIEDGTGKADSESYCSVATADKFHADRGNEAWDSVDNKEAALRKAADYMRQTYQPFWLGARVLNTQALDWPRELVPRSDLLGHSYHANNIIPKEVILAQAELALKASTEDLLPDAEPPVASEQVGPIAVHYFQNSVRNKKYLSVDRTLAPFLRFNGALKLVRS